MFLFLFVSISFLFVSTGLNLEVTTSCLMFSDVVDCSLMFSGVLTVLSSLDVKDESLSCLVSSVFFFQAFFPLLLFFYFLFFLGYPAHTLYTHSYKSY